jgi:hypothetical protein
MTQPESLDELRDEVARVYGSADRPPARVAATLAEIIGAPPVFGTCAVCGCATVGAKCYDCQRKQDLAVDARAETIASIPERFRPVRFGSDKILQCCHGDRELVARGEAAVSATHVLLIGHSGMGKTSLAVAMMRRWTEQTGKPALFCLATDLATAKARAIYGKENGEIAEARTAPLLVLDELGPDEFRAPASPVTDVIFHRHAHALPTWVTTWLVKPQADPLRRDMGERWDVKPVTDKYGEGFTRRITEGARVIDCSAKAAGK